MIEYQCEWLNYASLSLAFCVCCDVVWKLFFRLSLYSRFVIFFRIFVYHPNCNIEVCNLHLCLPVITTNVNAELLYYIIGSVSSFVQFPVGPYGDIAGNLNSVYFLFVSLNISVFCVFHYLYSFHISGII